MYLIQKFKEYFEYDSDTHNNLNQKRALQTFSLLFFISYRLVKNI